tara:strand:- start:237 stop:395 length:159 start_codon:yes stop_codon:yes gene_type:complete
MTKFGDMGDTEFIQHLDETAKVLKRVGQASISEELKEASRRLKNYITEHEKR